MGILPSNIIAKRFIANAQSLIGKFHFPLMLRSAIYISFTTASSFGNEARFFITFRSELLTDSITFVV